MPPRRGAAHLAILLQPLQGQQVSNLLQKQVGEKVPHADMHPPAFLETCRRENDRGLCEPAPRSKTPAGRCSEELFSTALKRSPTCHRIHVSMLPLHPVGRSVGGSDGDQPEVGGVRFAARYVSFLWIHRLVLFASSTVDVMALQEKKLAAHYIGRVRWKSISSRAPGRLG